ncbi:MAG: hypothetical protein NVV59_04175 [Chitinophagaceae bacterium]|nr:hypothetical protein [Chitinophagaceae bacterium]
MDVTNPHVTVETAEIMYPPKFTRPPADKSQVWLRSASSLALYLIIGFYFFKSLEWLLLITTIVVIHELGHFFAMKYFRYNDTGIFFVPLLGAYVSGTKREVSQRESAVILLAGPLPGMLIGIGCYFIYQYDPGLSIAFMSFEKIGLAFLFLNLINLLPIFPLDGGQLLNRVYLDEDNWVSKAFQWLSIAAMVWLAVFVFTPPVSYLLLFFPVMMTLRMLGDRKISSLEKEIQAANIDLNYSYSDLPDETYWKVRNIIIEHHPAFKDVTPAPPFSYHVKEEKIMHLIESLLDRHLIQDMNIGGKLFLLLIWIAALSCPWWLSIGTEYLKYLGIPT